MSATLGAWACLTFAGPGGPSWPPQLQPKDPAAAVQTELVDKSEGSPTALDWPRSPALEPHGTASQGHNRRVRRVDLETATECADAVELDAQRDCAAEGHRHASMAWEITADGTVPRTLQDPPPDPALEALIVDWEHGERSRAVDGLEQLQQSRSTPAGLRLLARWQFTVHRLDAALETLERLGSDPDRLKGLCLVRLNRYAEGLAALGSDNRPELLARLDALEALGRFDELAQAIEQARGVLDPLDPEILRRKGRVAFEAGDFATAEARYRQVLEVDPISAAALFGLGQALIRQGQLEAGLELLQRHRTLLPLFDQLEFAQRSLDLAPNHGPNWASLGDVQRKLGLLEPAVSSYTRALELSLGEARIAIVLRAARLEEEDLHDGARALARLELELATNRDLRLWVRASDVALRLGRIQQAEDLLGHALEARPKDPELLARKSAIERARDGRR